MLSNNKETLIKSLHTKKGREKHGLCLVEGKKVVDLAGDAIDFSFTKDDTDIFMDLVTTETPQEVAAVARIPEWSIDDIRALPTTIVLDGVQDPGNVGTILRLCLGFSASLVLIDSAEPSAPKVVRSSVGAMFQVPWIKVSRNEAVTTIESLQRSTYRLELGEAPPTAISENPFVANTKEPATLIVGSEGRGITIDIQGEGVAIPHDTKLESLNVGHAVAIVLHARFAQR